ncbi:pyridoxal phosphate-dependent transferase [Mycena alexandri]|uniref:Pyridoxal phosphate-dependent transferase n=1 Tax=Mycena alexandri TaxID=1745969 RepID=A0AAD6T655_9AGAR|nr:pyridoxal phosphate-dependent transferase [Mycena alexandri]
MDVEQFRKAGYAAIDRICDYYTTLQSQPVSSSVQPGYLAPLLPTQPPTQGEDFSIIAADYDKYIMPGLTHWQHPSFFAYFPTAASFEGILGDLYATAAPHPGFNWSCSPASTELEAIVMDWAAKLLGLAPAFHNACGTGGGALQTTASDSALVAAVAARERFVSTHSESDAQTPLNSLVIYVTTQTHSLGLKAARVLGLQVRALEVTTEDRYALRGETLRAALEEDLAVGRKPFILMATVGTTSSGAVDNLPEIQAVLADYPEIWLHIDAAWAGIALCCPETRDELYLDAINAAADSFCTNFHKWGLVNFDASTLWVRDRLTLTRALDITPPFLRTAHGDSGAVIDYRNWHLALGRRFRSLKLWFVLRGFGVQGFQAHVRAGIKLNNTFNALLANSEVLQLITPPSLALTVFRAAPKSTPNGRAGAEAEIEKEKDGNELTHLNALNASFFARLARRPDLAITQTVLNGVFCVRFAIGAARTTEAHVRAAFEVIEEEARAVVKEDLEARETATAAVVHV